MTAESKSDGSAGTQTVDTVGTGTDLTLLPQRVTSPRIIEAQDSRIVLEAKLVGKIPRNNTTPSVQNNEHWIAQNTVPVSITDFKNGQDGHHLYILGDGFTTTVHSAKIINIAGVDLLLDAGVIFHYLDIDGVWYQICCSDGGGGGGAVAWVDITGKPATFPPDYVGFPPSWTDISGKPATFPPDYVTYPPSWGSITGIPATFPPDYVTYPPAWGDLTGVPAVFPPDMSSVDLGDLADVDTAGQTATMFLRYDGALWIAESVAIPSGDLSGLNDVVITAAADGDVLTYDSGTSKWINQAPSGGATTLAALTDVNIPTPSNNQVLTYNTGTSKWVAQTPTAYGDAFLANNQTFTGVNTYSQNPVMPGVSFSSPFPAINSRDTDLAVDAGGLWYISSANGAFQVLKNTAAAGDFSTYDTVIQCSGAIFSTSAASLNLSNATASNPVVQTDATYVILYGPHATTPCHLYVGSNADPAIYLDSDNHWFRTQSGTNSLRIQRSGTTVNVIPLGTSNNCGTTTQAWSQVYVATGGGYNFNNIKVVGARVTGWNAPTGAVTRGTFAVAGATAATCAGAIAGIITDLRAHGLLGT